MKEEYDTQQKRNCEAWLNTGRNETVLGWILEAVSEAGWQQDVVWVDAQCPRNMLLTLLTYAYYRELWTTEEIEANLERDSVLKYICGSRMPTMDTIRHFRRGHREVLARCLSKVFVKAFTTNPADLAMNMVFVQRAAAELAEQRLRSAVLMEMIALDI